MSEKPKRFHRYKPESFVLLCERLAESISHSNFLEWRRWIAFSDFHSRHDQSPIVFAPEAK